MSEELIQRGLDRKNPTSKIGKWDYFSIGATTLKALKEASIIRNVNYGYLESKKVDGIIIHNKDVIAVIEFKQPKEFKTKAQKENPDRWPGFSRLNLWAISCLASKPSCLRSSSLRLAPDLREVQLLRCDSSALASRWHPWRGEASKP